MRVWVVTLVFVVSFGMASEAEEGKKKSKWAKAPAVGERIPEISAKTKDGSRNVALHKPKRLTVLVFGSHT